MKNLLHPLRPRISAVAHAGLYHFHQGAIPLPGVQSLAFEPSFALPLSAIQGNATFAGNSPRPLQGPQIWAGNPKPVAGLGGMVAGSFLSPGPLSDNDG